MAIQDGSGSWEDVQALCTKPFILPQEERYTNLITHLFRKKQYGYHVDFSRLQGAYLRYLQVHLVEIAASLDTDKKEGRSWTGDGKAGLLGPVLRNYVQAVRDHEYMAQFSTSFEDPFITTSQRLYDREVLRKAMLERKSILAADLVDDGHPALYSRRWERDIEGQHVVGIRPIGHKAFKRAAAWRIGMVIFGVIYLLSPMWLFFVIPDVLTQLSFVSGLLTLFGLAMAMYLKTLEGVFAATLAYAAVLMVFVGVTMQGLSPSAPDGS